MTWPLCGRWRPCGFMWSPMRPTRTAATSTSACSSAEPSSSSWTATTFRHSPHRRHRPGLAARLRQGRARPKWKDVVEAESRFVRAALRAGTPVMGICYGAQLMARALGGTSWRADAPELGWQRVDTTDPVLCPEGPWGQMHKDVFSPGPTSRVIGTSWRGPQCIIDEAHGARAIAWQFHPEVTAPTYERWVPEGYYGDTGDDPKELSGRRTRQRGRDPQPRARPDRCGTRLPAGGRVKGRPSGFGGSCAARRSSSPTTAPRRRCCAARGAPVRPRGRAERRPAADGTPHRQLQARQRTHRQVAPPATADSHELAIAFQSSSRSPISPARCPVVEPVEHGQVLGSARR